MSRIFAQNMDLGRVKVSDSGVHQWSEQSAQMRINFRRGSVSFRKFPRHRFHCAGTL